MRVYEARVPEGWTGQTLEGYLRQAFPLLPQHVIRDAFRSRDVKADGRRAAPDESPGPGAMIQLYTAYQAELPVVYEDQRVLIINKPAGISCEDDGRGGMTVQGLFDARPDQPKLIHRLDNQTCGLLMAAKDPQALEALEAAFRIRSVDKRYECLVKGTVRPASMTANAYILKDQRTGRMRVVSHETPDTRPISTAYETISTDGMLTRLTVHLLTGRTHQIRAHMAAMQHPILGDDVYGDRRFNLRMKTRRLMLCAREITLMDLEGGLQYLNDRKFSVPVPF